MIFKIVRWTINLTCLTMSISMSIYFFQALLDNSMYQIALIPIVIILEILAQYILSKARFFKRYKEKRTQAFGLFFLYIWYLLVFALFSGVSFFIGESAKVEKVDQLFAFSQNMNMEKWNNNNALLATLNAQLITEAKTGYGPRSRSIMQEIKQVKEEQLELEKLFNSQPIQMAGDEEVEAESSKKVHVNVFTEVARVFGMSPNFLKRFVFGTIVLFIYLGLALTNWNFRFCLTCGNIIRGSSNRLYCSTRCRREGGEVKQKKEALYNHTQIIPEVRLADRPAPILRSSSFAGYEKSNIYGG